MESYTSERKMKNTKFWTCLISGMVCIIVFLPILIFSLNTLITGRIVGEVKGGTLYYNEHIYIETGENIDIDVGEYIGKVTWDDTKSTSKIYKINGYPDYIYLNMVLGSRIYKLNDGDT